MGRFFGQRHSNGWHRQVDITAAGEQSITIGPIPNQRFPWAQLRQHTDLYLKKKGKLTADERDGCLKALLQKHAAKDVAMAACAHEMSPQAVRDLLRGDLNVEPGSSYGMQEYLRVFIVAKHVNPNAVSELDARWARILFPFSTPDTTAAGRDLEAIITLLMADVPADLVLHPHVDALARRAFRGFAAQLEVLRLGSQWARAQAVVLWLSTLSVRSVESTTETLRPEQMLDNVFPSWRIWAAWRPNVTRLRLWEGFLSDQRTVLRELLALEGPDFLGNGQEKTLCEGLITQGTNLSLIAVRSCNLHIDVKSGRASEARDILDRLLRALDAACRAGLNDTSLLTHLCVGKPINQETLQILECVSGMADTSVSTAVMQIYTGELESVRLAGVMQLLPALGYNRGQGLREILAPDLINHISNYMQKTQAMLRAQLQAGRPWDGTEMKLQAFGKGLQDALWLRPLFDAPLRALIDTWPTLGDIKDLHSLRIDAQKGTVTSSLTRKIDQYCMGCLIMRSAIDVPTKRLVEALICLWKQARDPDRRVVALLIAEGSGKNSSFRCRCLMQLLDLPDGFVHSLRRILQNGTKDADIACVDLARLLASAPLADAIACWGPVLRRMIDQRRETLVDYTLTHLTAMAWFQWLEDLSFIYGDMMAWHPDSSPPILRPSLHAWAQRLATYIPTITRLESVLGSGPVTRGLMTGCEGPLAERLIRILDILQEHNEGRYWPAMQVIISLLEFDSSNANEVCEALSLLAAATPDCVEACMRVLEL